MENKQPGPGRLIIFAGIAIAFAWLLLLRLWLLFYARGFSILHNVGIFFLSLAVLAVLETAIWIPRAVKNLIGSSASAKSCSIVDVVLPKRIEQTS